MRDFRELKVWWKGHWLSMAVYAAIAAFPKERLYGLTSQVRRSAASIPANIQVASGSASELEYHLLARDLNLLTTSEQERLIQEVTEIKRIPTSFTQRLKAESSRQELTANSFYKPYLDVLADLFYPQG